MKTLRRLLFALSVIPLQPIDAYRLALQQSEVLSQQEERIEQAESQIRQAWGSVLPSVKLNGSYQKQDKIKDPLAGRFSPTFNPALRVNLTQPLFRGFREFAALRQTEAMKEATKSDRLNAERVLFAEVMGQYFEVEFLSKSLKLLKEQEKAFQKRTQEIQTRVSTGQSRQSELLAVRSAHARLISRVRQSEGMLLASQESLGFFLGRPAGSFATRPQSFSFQQIPDQNYWIEKIENRPDIQSLKIQLNAQDENVKIAKGAHWGEADLIGNYWLRRAGVADQINWDIAFQFSVPLFQGGVISAQVDQATSRRKESELALARLRRSAETEVRSLHALLAGEWNRYGELKSAVEIAQKNVELQSRDYRFGLVRNIDVLMALDELYTVKIDYEHSKTDLQNSVYRLNASIGELQSL